MYSTLLVPLDGSAFSERALPVATTLARRLGARVILVRVAVASALPGANLAQAQIEAVREAQAYLEALASGMFEQGLNVEIAVPYGDAAESILLEVSLYGADLVVMCTHGRSGLGRWIYGSVAEKVLAQSPAPVLLIRPIGDIQTPLPELSQASVLVPLDGSSFAEAALLHAVALARALDGILLLLRVIEQPTIALSYPEVHAMQQSSAELRQEAESYLQGVAEYLQSEDLLVHTVVREGWPADTIAYQGAALRPSLIVMATHGRSGIARLLLGSVALEVVRRSPLPILLVRPDEQPNKLSQPDVVADTAMAVPEQSARQ